MYIVQSFTELCMIQEELFTYRKNIIFKYYIRKSNTDGVFTGGLIDFHIGIDILYVIYYYMVRKEILRMNFKIFSFIVDFRVCYGDF